MPFALKRSSRRLLIILAALPLVVCTLALLYILGMEYLEGRSRTYVQSLLWASETMTTTGYGADNSWQHPLMALYIMLTQFAGQSMMFIAFPLVVLPYFEERFEVRLQHSLPAMAGKVLFYRFGPAIEALLDEFKSKKTPFVILEEDLETARNLRDRGYNVVFAKIAADPAVLHKVLQAQAVVADGNDHANATFTMAVREYGYTGPVYVLADDPVYRHPMLQIGATDVFSPAHVLGAALASQASTRISPPAEGMHLLGQRLGMAEFRVRAESPLAGKKLGELRLRERHGVTLIGQWLGGSFSTTKGPQTVVEAGAILVAVGAHTNLEVVERMAMPIRRAGPVVLAGYGAVGQKVVELLRNAGERCVVIDSVATPGVDIVGSVLEHSTLERAHLREASAVVLALSDDSESVFAAAVVRDYAPQVPLVVRVQRTRNTARIYRAGADFAISVGQVAGQILACQLLGEQALQVENRIRFIRCAADAMAGKHPWHNEDLERTGTKIVALERGGAVIMEFAPDFAVQAEDVLYLCGSMAALERYRKAFSAAVF